MAARIEHSGVVERTERDTVYVRITSHSACGTCKAREACGLAEAQDKIVAVKSPDAAQFAVGEQVMVGVRRSAGAVAVILAYVGALAVLLAVLVAAIAVLGWSEGAAHWPHWEPWVSITAYYGSSGIKSNTQFISQ